MFTTTQPPHPFPLPVGARAMSGYHGPAVREDAVCFTSPLRERSAKGRVRGDRQRSRVTVPISVGFAEKSGTKRVYIFNLFVKKDLC